MKQRFITLVFGIIQCLQHYTPLYAAKDCGKLETALGSLEESFIWSRDPSFTGFYKYSAAMAVLDGVPFEELRAIEDGRKAYTPSKYISFLPTDAHGAIKTAGMSDLLTAFRQMIWLQDGLLTFTQILAEAEGDVTKALGLVLVKKVKDPKFRPSFGMPAQWWYEIPTTQRETYMRLIREISEGQTCGVKFSEGLVLYAKKLVDLKLPIELMDHRIVNWLTFAMYSHGLDDRHLRGELDRIVATSN